MKQIIALALLVLITACGGSNGGGGGATPGVQQTGVTVKCLSLNTSGVCNSTPVGKPTILSALSSSLTFTTAFQGPDLSLSLGGSVLTAADARALEARGVAATFGATSAMEDIPATIERLARAR